MNRLRISRLLFLTGLLVLVLSPVTFSQIPDPPPYVACGNELFSEDFGSSQPAGWTGDFNMGMMVVEGWVLQSGPTPSMNTGPDGAFSGDYYTYLETNGPAPLGSTFSIQTPEIVLAPYRTGLRFKLLMYGAQTGSFQVNILTGPGFGTSTQLLDVIGEQHSDGSASSWQDVFIDLKDYDGQTVKIEFVGMKGSGDLGDIGLDAIQICDQFTIPTLSTWGVLILFTLFLIIGVAKLRQPALIVVKER